MPRPLACLALAVAVVAAASCGRGGGGTVGGVSAEEAAQLNNAAEMLDASADDLAAPDGNAAGNVE